MTYYSKSIISHELLETNRKDQSTLEIKAPSVPTDGTGDWLGNACREPNSSHQAVASLGNKV